MDDAYDYANARLRAMKSRLLTRSDYAALLDEPTIEGVIARLTQTAYQPSIEAALITTTGWECVSLGLRRHFAETLARITRFFEGAPQRLWKILIGHWEAFNVKTILRGQALTIPADEILDILIPAGDLGEPDLRRLTQQTSVRATVDLLATWNHPYARALLEALPRYAEHRDLALLELALDRARYVAAFKELAQVEDSDANVVKQALRGEIDATNLLTVIRLSEWGSSAARFAERYGTRAPAALLLRGGSRMTDKLLAYQDIPALDQLMREMHDTDFGDALTRGQARYNETHTLTAFEDEIEAHLTRKHLALFYRDPLSIAIAAAYLTALVNEIRNLRVIGRGKAAGWQREQIEKELRLWQN